MPPKRARVSAECAIANIMRLMDDDDNSDSDDGELAFSVRDLFVSSFVLVCLSFSSFSSVELY
jgi:hypothetical protein